MRELAGNKLYCKTVESTPFLSHEEELELTREYKRTGCLKSRDKVILSNQKYLIKEAFQYATKRVSAEDLIQEGNIALLKAFRRFDPEKGFRFMTYASWWILASLTNYMFAHDSLLCGGKTQAQKKLWFRVVPRVGVLMDQGSTLEEAFAVVAEENEVSVKNVKTTYNLRTAAQHDCETVSRIEGQDVLLDEKRQTEKIRSLAYDGCSRDIEEDIVASRLLCDDPETLSSLGIKHNLSRERIRQIEANVLDRLRRVA